MQGPDSTTRPRWSFGELGGLWREHVALSPARAMSRPYNTALEDMFSLAMYADTLRFVGRWSEALIVATAVVQCLRALVQLQWESEWTEDLERRLGDWREDHRDIMLRVCAPGTPLVAAISEVEDVDERDGKEASGEGASLAESAALVWT
ncbi:hypothetical protein CCMSSC00406_0009102 [Pleurotus cornucopiae]|uniref:Uncharacterized protein n=1 Tax=Pleurotus cornucopiae TaxID=5321 RepID=A0ACB7J7L9_PLECO|nr:hypothetical protein CCMSSC00406_0009102 [Pleurotus cornucopiae]